jgi:hypothetical protein
MAKPIKLKRLVILINYWLVAIQIIRETLGVGIVSQNDTRGREEVCQNVT